MKKIYLLLLLGAPFLLKAQNGKQPSNINAPLIITNGCYDATFDIARSALDTVIVLDTLIVVDNFIFHGKLSDLNHAEIKSITILKDPEAKKIWGNNRNVLLVVIQTTRKDSAKVIKQKEQKDSTNSIQASNRSSLMVVFPNPAKEQFTVSLSNKADHLSLYLLDTNGKIWRTWRNVRALGKQHQFNINGIPPGSYLAVAQTPGGICTEKLLVSW